MIPLYDTIPSKHFPLVNWLLILGNLAVYIFQLSLGEEYIESFFNQFGLIPSSVAYAFSQPVDTWGVDMVRPFFTNMFLHGGFWHFLGNMWMLYIFGNNVEDMMGNFRYLLFYILSGILASLTHFVLYIHSPIPAIGASGAIAGVMAAYMFLFPGSRVLTFIPIFIIIPLLLPIPAFVFIGLWFIGQLLSGTMHLMYHSSATGIAFWAHIGGFLAGAFLFRSFLRPKEKSG